MTMSIRRIAIAAAGLALTAGVIAPSAASASSSAPTGTRSLAEVLLADGNQFDSNSADFDIVTEAVLAVLAAKPASPVKVLTDGSVPLTAFNPDDKAFRILAISLTGSGGTEQEVFGKVAGLGIDTVEQVLLYHVVPGATITSRAAARADGAALTTALGPTITVDVLNRHVPVIKLIDKDRDAANPMISRAALNINKGNVQIAHGISRVLRPVNL